MNVNLLCIFFFFTTIPILYNEYSRFSSAFLCVSCIAGCLGLLTIQEQRCQSSNYHLAMSKNRARFAPAFSLFPPVVAVSAPVLPLLLHAFGRGNSRLLCTLRNSKFCEYIIAIALFADSLFVPDSACPMRDRPKS